MDNILVTGGGGFIGSNLVDTLVSKGFYVFVIDNFSTGLQSNINSKVKYYNNDIMEFIHDKDLLVNIIINNSST